MRTKTQNLTVFPEDINGISVSATDVSSPYADLTLGGADATTDLNGVAYVDFSDKTYFTPLVRFTTGATGSTAVATITGLDQYGYPQTEDVTMPGASGAVTSTKPFGRIDSISIDGAYTNLEVGVEDGEDQYGKWVVFDTYQNPFTVFLDLTEPTNGSTLTIEMTSDPDIWVPGSNFGVDVYNAVSPFAPGITGAKQGLLTQQVGIAGQNVNLPFLAARLRHTAGTAGKWRARFTQSGGYR